MYLSKKNDSMKKAFEDLLVLMEKLSEQNKEQKKINDVNFSNTWKIFSKIKKNVNLLNETSEDLLTIYSSSLALSFKDLGSNLFKAKDNMQFISDKKKRFLNFIMKFAE